VLLVCYVKQVPTTALSADNNDSSIVINRMFRNKLNPATTHASIVGSSGRILWLSRCDFADPKYFRVFQNSEGKPKRRKCP
jgi:hypothetical protein